MRRPIVPPVDWLIIGLGWLGQALADNLTLQGAKVKGTHRSECNFLSDFVPDIPCKILFLNTPPLLQLSPLDYVERLKSHQAQRIIFISSTSVYGADCGEVDEQSEPCPDTPSGKWLSETEAALRDNLKSKLLIIRSGGLIGGKRHPIFHLQGKKNIPRGNESINLIHRIDLINIIKSVPSDIHLLNAISPHHPKKSDYYTSWANKLNLTPPTFVEGSQTNRIITSTHLDSFYRDWQCMLLDYI
jgi:hypothetical protein